MGEYIIYYRGKVVGGIYDDRFLVKPTSEIPYDGAKSEMLLVNNIESKEFLKGLFEKVYEELPEIRKRNAVDRK